MSIPLQPYEPIRPVTENLFCVDGDWHDTAFRRRMTVIRLKDSSLVIHCAIQLGDKDLAELDRLGNVSTIVIPNIFHGSEARFYAERYPNAKVYVPAKVRDKYAKMMKVTGTLEEDWPHEGELPRISFKKSLVAETVFIHPASRTLIVTDLAMNLSSSDFKSAMERRILGKWNGILDVFGPSKLTRYIAARDRGEVRDALKEIASFDFDRVIMSHGRIVETGGKKGFLEGYARIYGELYDAK